MSLLAVRQLPDEDGQDEDKGEARSLKLDHVVAPTRGLDLNMLIAENATSVHTCLGCL